MEEVYITIANSLKIIKNIDLNFNHYKENVYDKPISFLNHAETQKLKFVRELFRDSDKFLKDIYTRIEVKDSFSLIWEGAKPAYHFYNDCPLLKSKYINFKVPFDIKNKGKNEVEKYRNWFISNLYLIYKKPDAFSMRHYSKWGFELNPKAIIKDNSGATVFNNFSLEELKSRIDVHLEYAKEIYYFSPKTQAILKQFSKNTYLAYKSKTIPDNNTGLTDEELKTFLRKYDERVKRPLKKELIEYYRIKFNPKLKFKGKLLEQLNFKICSKCLETNINDVSIRNTDIKVVSFCKVAEDIENINPNIEDKDIYLNFTLIDDELIF